MIYPTVFTSINENSVPDTNRRSFSCVIHGFSNVFIELNTLVLTSFIDSSFKLHPNLSPIVDNCKFLLQPIHHPRKSSMCSRKWINMWPLGCFEHRLKTVLWEFPRFSFLILSLLFYVFVFNRVLIVSLKVLIPINWLINPRIFM